MNWTQRFLQWGEPDDSTTLRPWSQSWVMIVGAALSIAAGAALSFGGPFDALLVLAAAVGLMLMRRPFAILTLVVALIALEALNTIRPAPYFTLTGIKILGFILIMSLLPDLALRRMRLRLDWPLWAFLVFLAAAASSLLKANNLNAAIISLLTYIQLFIFWVAVRHLVTTRARLRVVAGLAVAALLASALFALWQYFRNSDARVLGTSQNASVLAADLGVAVAFAIVLALATRRAETRLSWLACAAVLVGGVLVCLSRAAYAAAFPAFLAAGLYSGRFRRTALTVAVALPIVFFALPLTQKRIAETSLEHDLSTRGHAYSIEAGLKMMLDNPVFGVGIGNFPDHYLHYTNDPLGRPRSAHSTFLSVGSEMGIPALAAFLLMHALAMVTLWKAKRQFESAGDAEGVLWCGAIAAIIVYFAFIGLLHEMHASKFLWFALAVALVPPDSGPGRETP